MKVTTFTAGQDGSVNVAAAAKPDSYQWAEFEGRPLNRVRRTELFETGGMLGQFVEIGAGGNFVMHSGPEFAFCQIVSGRGLLGLPGGEEIAYEAPELFLFHPDTLHDWHGVKEDTLLSVLLVDQPATR